MTIIDAHCDVLGKLLLEPTLDFAGNDPSLDVTMPKLRQAGVLMQLFAIWIPERVDEPGFKHVLHSAELFRDKVVGQAGMALVRTSEDLTRAAAGGTPGAMLTMEGADALAGSMERLRAAYDLGVRCLGLTWNYANWAADGVLEPRNGALTLKGRRLVAECNAMGIIIDVSHLAERGFWEVAERSERPFVASHSNVLELCGHPRNLNREQIRCIASRGGVIGINFFPPFLRTDGPAAIDDVVRHIETALEWGGDRAVGLGSDFDGIGSKVEGLEDPTGYEKLAEALAKRLTDEQTERVLYRNWYEFFVSELPKTECN
ncbi:dipeptidase [Paenibacillus flagellatus]|uniref:Membrane dipeptidase n=1 Tax=Paenibacillus flagellatus TaxID=2211139 RepID=A0A2V5KBW7_9BACL|nr:dipeptidase [Paenibacillus flagellatus]PYI55413.1 membrane dipeptidase [Paenibacillus flagellatus]